MTPDPTKRSSLAAACTLACLLAACSAGESPETRFDRHYRAWLGERASISFSSRTGDYLALPAFRSIVNMGPAAVPVIRRHLEAQSCRDDFFLASAIIEIRGWRREALARPGDSEQALCRAVLDRLRAAA